MKDWKGNHKTTFTTLGASNHSNHEREKHDYYATDPIAADLICEVEKFVGGFGKIVVEKDIYQKDLMNLDMML